ncbi:MAG TPA: PCRF domain-containing protein [Candidatus Jorgensenbacteria bacterium]|nr:PCRF domain-containing protein [Candidatus Jorgensenbacteria bacterium]
MTQKIILEIRAGTGGDEAALFAADLAKMYQKYADKRKWKFVVKNTTLNELGGYKTFVAKLTGEGIYDALQFESGVHRVQRVPHTEKSGRIHTSTASVAVLPFVETREMDINPQDLDISFFRSSGPGGQHVNKVETGVRIQHVPTGVVAASQSERSQARNRECAMTMLRTALYEQQQREQKAEQSGIRKEQIGTAERAEKIRTYNYPQNRITDHRINKKWQQLDRILSGEMDVIVRAFKKVEKK